MHAADFSKIAVLGLKLGMTQDEVRARYPSVQTRIVKHWGTDDVLFYTATIPPEKINNWSVVSMLFSSFSQGRKLYKLQVDQFVGDTVYGELEKKVINRFGPPDCSFPSLTGKKMVWGNCSQNNGAAGEKLHGRQLSFIYDDAQISLIMEDEDVSAYIKNQVLKHDEETRLKEVRELDF